MEKGKDKDTFNLTFIVQVDNYFMVRNFLSKPGKASVQKEGILRKEAKSFFFGARKSIFFRQIQIPLPV